jgi:peptidase YpeB-like protein
MPLPTTKTAQALVLTAALAGGFPSQVLAQLTTEQDVQRTLEQAGYQEVRDVKFTSEGITAKAVKDGKQVSLMLDSNGKVKQPELRVSYGIEAVIGFGGKGLI